MGILSAHFVSLKAQVSLKATRSLNGHLICPLF